MLQRITAQLGKTKEFQMNKTILMLAISLSLTACGQQTAEQKINQQVKDKVHALTADERQLAMINAKSFYEKEWPYWRYHHADGVMHPRPHHKAWNGIVLPYDHPFWKTHFCPNGWMCHCYISAASPEEYARALVDGRAQPPDGWDALDAKTGAPVGIDKGFDYAPGANTATSLRQMVQDKLINYPPAISKALTHDVNRYIETGISASEFASKVIADTAIEHQLWLGFVENSALSDAAGTEMMGYFVMLQGNSPRHINKTHQHDGNGQRVAAPADYDYMMSDLTTPDSTRAGEIVNGLQRIVVFKAHGDEVFRWVFEIRPGKRNRSIVPVTLSIKTKGTGS
jgi:hypothetical protein